MTLCVLISSGFPLGDCNLLYNESLYVPSMCKTRNMVKVLGISENYKAEWTLSSLTTFLFNQENLGSRELIFIMV